jgi:hypothetical protein
LKLSVGSESTYDDCKVLSNLLFEAIEDEAFYEIAILQRCIHGWWLSKHNQGNGEQFTNEIFDICNELLNSKNCPKLQQIIFLMTITKWPDVFYSVAKEFSLHENLQDKSKLVEFMAQIFLISLFIEDQDYRDKITIHLKQIEPLKNSSYPSFNTLYDKWSQVQNVDYIMLKEDVFTMLSVPMKINSPHENNGPFFKNADGIEVINAAINLCKRSGGSIAPDIAAFLLFDHHDCDSKKQSLGKYLSKISFENLMKIMSGNDGVFSMSSSFSLPQTASYDYENFINKVCAKIAGIKSLDPELLFFYDKCCYELLGLLTDYKYVPQCVKALPVDFIIDAFCNYCKLAVNDNSGPYVGYILDALDMTLASSPFRENALEKLISKVDDIERDKELKTPIKRLLCLAQADFQAGEKYHYSSYRNRPFPEKSAAKKS